MRLLFTCRPGDGHFLPLLPIAHAAVAREHEVLFASGEPTASKARELGFQGEAAGIGEVETLKLRAALLGGVQLRKDQTRNFAFDRWFSVGEAPQRLIDIERLIDRFRPDILIHEAAELAGPLAAAAAGIPWVTVGYGPLLPPELPRLAAAALTPLWRSRGLNVPANAGLYEHLYVDPCAPAMQIAAINDLRASIRFRPPSKGTERPYSNRIEPGRIYVTFGTGWDARDGGWDRMRITVAGAADAASAVVVTLGPHADVSQLSPTATHVEIHQYVPQDEILWRCAGMVSHAGAGTLLGAVSWGVPSLLLPQFADQFDNAERAVSVGVAISLQPAEITREAVAGRVQRILADATTTPALARIRNELADAPDIGIVIDRIELLTTHS